MLIKAKAEQDTILPTSVRQLLDPDTVYGLLLTFISNFMKEREWVEDMELMYYYTTHVSTIGLGIRTELLALWRDYIPPEGFKHSFLLHGLLALAALKMANDQPSESARCLTLCDKHQAIAISGFRQALAGPIGPEIAVSLFALSSVISMSVMARACAKAASQPSAQYINPEEMANMFYLTM